MASTIPHLTKYESTKEYWYKGQLKERGWTEGAITKFLGSPDATKDNPKAKSSPPMKLWLITRVEQSETTPEFQQWKEKTSGSRKANSDRMLHLMAEKRESTIHAFTSRIRNSVHSQISKYKLVESLEDDAIAHWSDNKTEHYLNRDDIEAAFEVVMPDKNSLDPQTLRRWVENFARHELSNYETLLDQLHGAIGREQAYSAMKTVVSEEVSRFYDSHGI